MKDQIHLNFKSIIINMLTTYWYLWLAIICLTIIKKIVKSKRYNGKSGNLRIWPRYKSKSSNLKIEPWPYYEKKLLSQPEQILYFRLVQAFPNHIIHAQVQLARLIEVKKGYNQKAWFNHIGHMSVDFVICNKDSSIVAVIELDDATHQRADRQTADIKKNKALKSASIQIIRWQTNAMPDLATIQNTFMKYINGTH